MSERLAIDEDWRRVSPRYVAVVVVGTLVTGVVAAAIVAVLFAVLLRLAPAWWVVAAIGVVTLVQVVLAGRRTRAIGYRMRDDDLLVTRGILFLRLVAVPYGRMQLIDITRGPVARALGLADLKFVTAAAASDVVVPGLVEADATALRDRLIEVAESRRTGL